MAPMSAGEKDRAHRVRRMAVALTGIAALVVALGPASAPAAKSKKKKKPKAAVTKTASVAFGSGTQATTTAGCTGKTHASGGGYAIAPSFTAPATGLRSLHAQSSPAGNRGWTSAAGAFTAPAASGNLTGYVRCESNRLGKIATRSSSSLTLNPGVSQNLIFNCAPGTHVISGGFAGTAIANFADPTNGWRIMVLQSRRTGPGQWTVSVYNKQAPGGAATITGFVVCELNGKGRAVSEVAASTALAEDQRRSADATCPKKKHVVSGGFLVTPTGPGQVPGVGIDENLPVGNRGWHIGLYDFPTVTLPAGATLTGYAYCKKG
jgi:hypothetical protein